MAQQASVPVFRRLPVQAWPQQKNEARPSSPSSLVVLGKLLLHNIYRHHREKSFHTCYIKYYSYKLLMIKNS